MRTNLPMFETERLIIREIKEDDMFDMNEYASIPYVGPMAGWEPHTSLSYTREVIKSFNKKHQFGQLGVFAIILKSEDKMIGTCELHSYIKDFKAELGYTISPKYWGNGYAGEASWPLVVWGFSTLNLKRIECSTLMNNDRSKRVTEKLGFKFEGIRRKGYMLYDNTINDLCCYSMTDDDFKKIIEVKSC